MSRSERILMALVCAAQVFTMSLSAKRGFKWPQAMAGDIYLHGRGAVPRDLEAGIGWLGAVASPRTEPQIDS